MKRLFLITLVFASVSFAPMTYAESATYLITRGVGRVISSAGQIPIAMYEDTKRYFPFGIITGIFRGSARMVIGTVAGAIDVARGAAPFAKYAVLLI